MNKSCSDCLNKCEKKENFFQKKQCNKSNVFDWLSNIKSPFEYQKYDIVEVQFKNKRKEFFLNKEKIFLNKGDTVTVETKSGIGYDIGLVSLTGELVKFQIRNYTINPNTFKKIYRKSTCKEINSWKYLKRKEFTTILKAKKIAKNLNLSMKICDIEYQGDGKKAIFYYTAENRIDFRKLIKEFALYFHIRIEMRQIGYRQEAAKISGIGSCGRELCCSTWLKNFKSVTTNSARYQQLSINMEKLTGQCSKLKCCLNYELDAYLDTIKDFPDFNRKIHTEKGIAQCMKIDVFKREMWFSYVKNSNIWFRIKVKKIKEIFEKNKIAPPLEELSTSIQKKELIFKDLSI
ncbi:regulatory iron-sulfur-containing complex subunit RicT [Blattabacterium sp. (Blaberus giganteus)]|uniref:PSP1 domain-containing protein n=1 Tax=Blattabacterium sp. (Blaberus giganteus) TaxID=1186051 RepID=UPI00025F6F60|nr:regulatory iron-sulfur-containing complex subunit RicT [Blattabacterium sp. (Blaberus giganteus)]AFJ90787.1 PSP1 domain-containing protein [Blattabacterium sp. (Blaberus giganteus)]